MFFIQIVLPIFFNILMTMSAMSVCMTVIDPQPAASSSALPVIFPCIATIEY